ncbi:cell division protein FtsZ [uncultured Selenomonas sp.]|uniref:cell division protein FtsZ n=1 Tax=uncultured Selenomonas sp. TaxID=159275 RepID=UPI0028F0366E|nr:cell division protein FtsZ [uncultured Selenomonas sp.]
MPTEGIIQAKITIKVVGVGGGGGNILRSVRENYNLDMTLVGLNSDLRQLHALEKQGITVLPIGEKLTQGRGTGGRVEVGEEAARSEEKAIRQMLEGTDLVIITATMGGGLGTGAAPVVAEIAHDMGILSIGVVTTPFHFEMSRKMQTAQAGIARMQGMTDAFITMRNDNLLKIAPDRKMSFVDAFALADEVLRQTVGCVAELILTTGVINVDFADVTTIFRQSASSETLLAIGTDETPQKAVRKAMESPLLDRSTAGARGVVLNLTGGPAMSLRDVDEAVHYIQGHAHPAVNIIAGLVVQENMAGKVQATLVATDFDESYVPPEEG